MIERSFPEVESGAITPGVVRAMLTANFFEGDSYGIAEPTMIDGEEVIVERY